MRISDWSSDVCSSDLRRHDLIRVRHGEQQRLGHVALEQERAGASEYPCSEPVGQSRHGPEESMTTRGRKMFIAGNGPSLKELDFSWLQGVDWLGMNAAYRHWDRIGIYPSL